MLIQHLKDEIHSYIEEEVDACVEDLKKSLEARSYQVDMDYNGFEINLIPKKIAVNVDMVITSSKSGESSKRDNFKFIVPSRFYDIAVVVHEIISQEARFCNFEQQGFMLFYPQFDIDKFRTGDGITIYEVKHRTSKENFKFAVRSCVIPPGF